ncbi:lysophospholipase [Rhodococcus sp. USK10]|uniref:alpha/beta fold hydrolase n=1 Tax=Rhodococcus sp. USK10 TaxID=2789739 RepID=UPI001C5CD4A4|nr:alpha/beta fold hydrolase [Rhodococcus sp. USK10]QYB01880.1 lysophospholipase [Rhodococcus sp. USK10]
MPFFDGVRNKVYYRHWAARSPHAQVLLLHGFGEHTGHYHRLAGQLTDAGIEVWGPDHLGHGHTGGRAGMFPSVDELASNAGILLDLMTSTHPDLPVVIVGHSLGALTGALLAMRTATGRTGLVMTGAPLWGLPPEAEGRTDLIMAKDEAYLDALANDPLGFDTAPAEPNLWSALAVAGCKVRTGLPALIMPILLINGEHDAFAAPGKAAEFAGELHQCRAVAIPGGYHDIPNDLAHREVAGLIIEATTQWCSAVRPVLSASSR